MAYYRGLNINIRCIEMYTAMTGQPAFNILNINIRCIEMINSGNTQGAEQN